MKISVLGCGWLGFPLAEHLISLNHRVKGSTTTQTKLKALKDCSIKAYVLTLNPELSAPEPVDGFWDADVLILNIPPGRGRDRIIDYHTKQIQSVIDKVAASSIEFVIFISSTSVYPKHPGRVTEEDAIPGKAGRDSGNALLKAEEMLMESTDFETTVLRFGGLYGGDRHPAKYMAGRTNLDKAAAPVNLIHRDDCIRIITQIAEENITGHIFNAVCDGHPTRADYYTKAAQVLGLKPPAFMEQQTRENYKIVSNEKLKRQLPYHFIHPDPAMPR